MLGLVVVFPGVAFASSQLSTPAAPSLVAASSTSVSGTFTPDPNAQSSTINLYQGGNVIASQSGITTGSFSFTSLISGDTYSATVTSIGDGTNYTNSAEGAQSAPVTLPAPQQLATPVAPAISQTTVTSITVTFVPDPHATSSTITLNDVTSGPPLTDPGNTSGTYTFTGLTPGDTYDATITSIGDGTNYLSSPAGATSSSITLALTPLPKPVAPTLSETSTTSITVTFTPNPQAVSSTITLTNTTTSTPTTVTGNTTGTALFSGLTPSDTYAASVTSIGDQVNFSNSPPGSSSAPLTLTVPQLTRPAAPSISQTTTTSISVTFTPDPQAVSSTIILTNTTTPATTTVTGNTTGTALFSGLTPTDTYTATITSVGDGVNFETSNVGSASSPLTLTVPQLSKPVAPSLSQTTPTSITVTFTPDPHAVSSTVALDNTTTSTLTSTTGITGATAHFTGLTPGDIYTATITSIGDGVNYSSSPVGTVSAPLTLTLPQLAQPVAPALSQVTPTSVKVTYTPDPNAVSSTITLHDVTANSTTPITGNTSGTFTFTGLTTGDTFTATITSVGDGLNYATSVVGVSSSPLTLALLPLGSPQVSIATLTNTSVTVSFAAVPNASSYSATVYDGSSVVGTNAATCLPASCVVHGLTVGTAYTVVVLAIGDHITYNNSAPSTAVPFVTTSVGPTNAPPPSDIAASSLGSPVSGTVSGTAPTIVTLATTSTSSTITVPVGALPTGTTVSVYPIASITALATQVPANHSYVVAVAISWQTATGTSPGATTPLTLTITDVSIVAGDTLYLLTPSGLVADGTASANGSATLTFTTDPVFVVTAVAKSAQSPLLVNSATVPVSHSVKLSTIGGSGTGSITYSVADGTAKGCTITSSEILSASTFGTCMVTATKSSDSDYGAVSSVAAAIKFTPLTQATLQVASANGSVGKPVTLVVTGGSGDGAVVVEVANGTAKGCSLAHANPFTLTASSPGTCLVVARKGGDATHSATSSSRVAIRFIHPKVAAKPVVAAIHSKVSGGATSSIVLTGSGLRGVSVSTTTKGVGVHVVKSTSTSLTLTLHVARSVRSGLYRLTISNKNGVTSTTFRVQARPSVNVAALIDALFAGYREAWAVSPTAGIIYAYQHDYPGSATSESAFLACYQKANVAQTGETDTPVLSTLRPTPTWQGLGPNTPAWNFAGKKPSGATYSITDVEKTVYSSGPPSHLTATVHVTILNGVAYFYFVPAC